MQFEIKRQNVKIGKVLYDAEEESFDSTLLTNTDISIGISYINIGIDSSDMIVKSIWGYSPKSCWNEKKLTIPYAEDGNLTLLGNYEPGLSIRLDKNGMWKSYIDKKTKWFCLGNTTYNEQDMFVKINENTIVVLDRFGELNSIFIHLAL